MAWLLGQDQSWPSMAVVLIGFHMAPNGVLTGSLSRKFRGGSPDRHQIQPSCQKWTEILRDLGRDFRIFWIFPKWKTAGMVGQDSAWEVQKRYFPLKKQVFLQFLAISHYLGVPPGVPPSLLLAPLGHLTVLDPLGAAVVIVQNPLWITKGWLPDVPHPVADQSLAHDASPHGLAWAGPMQGKQSSGRRKQISE